MALVIGTRLGSFEVLGALGAGGMGEVYRARDGKLGREVALKILRDSVVADPDRLARFRREARVLASLNHPNIGHIYGFEDTGAIHALVLELVDGPTLADRISRGPIAPADAWPIANQIAMALEAAHELGVIHRDLKPANIKVRDDGTVKVLDFGLAKALESAGASGSGSDDSVADTPTVTSPPMTAVGVVFGTPAYMSPEQAQGRVADKRADVWAFGVVLFEMLTGRRPFRGQTSADLLAALMTANPDWSALPAATPPAMRQLLGRCLERDPKERLRDIGEARVQIQRTIAGAAGDASSGSAVMVATGERAARGRWIAAAAIMGLIVGAGGTMMWWRHANEVARESLAFEIETGREIGTPIIAPDGRSIVYVDGGRLVVRHLDNFELHVLDGPIGATNPFWSPNSGSIGYFIGPQVHTISALGSAGTDQVVAKGAFEPVGGAWCAKGIVVSRLRSDNSKGGLFLASNDQAPIVPFDPSQDEWALANPSCLPDGRMLAVVVNHSETESYVAVVDGITRIRIFTPNPKADRVYAPTFVSPNRVLFALGTSNRGIWSVQVASDLSRVEGPPVKVLTTDGVALSVSRDGTLVALSGIHTTEQQMVWVDRTGTPIRTFGRPQAVHALAASPDGKHVAVETGDGERRLIFIHHEVTSQRFSIAQGDSRPAVSPDNNRVAFIDADGRLLVRPITGGEATVVDPGPAAGPVWSPNGRLVYELKGPDRSGLWIAGVGETPKALNLRGAKPAVSPDGLWLAYGSGLSGEGEVFVTTLAEPRVQTPVSTVRGRNPRWNPRGGELFFEGGGQGIAVGADQPSRRQLYAVKIDTRGGLKIGTPTVLFDASLLDLALDYHTTRTWDVGPDGQTFIVRTTGQTGVPVIVGVKNLDVWMRTAR